MRKGTLPAALLSAFLLLWIWAAIGPVDRFDWLLENLLVFLLVPPVIYGYFRRPLSNTSYVLIAVFASLHVIGSHWSYSNVPLPWREWGLARNPYDRAVHMSFGLLLTKPIAEAFTWRGGSKAWNWMLAVQAVLAFSAVYEIIEMVTAYIVAPQLADAFLGSQGDPFDGIWDMAMAWFGSLVAVAMAVVAWALRRGSGGRARTA